MRTLCLIAIGMLLGGCLVPMVIIVLAEISWWIEDRRERLALDAARRRGALGRIVPLADRRQP